MITNLFLIFDPSIFLFNILPWSLVIVAILSIFVKFFNNSQYTLFFLNLLLFIKNELKPLLSVIRKGILIFYISLFSSLLLINFFSLFPFIFTRTAHISLAFPLSFVIWLGIIIFGWLNNRKHMISHRVPFGTPLVLINFIVIIELIRNIIRPITLSVRLTANIVAGHLLLRLLGRFSLMRILIFNFSILGIIILSLLELAVSFIQSYVFITLITLYSTEVHYE